MKIERSALMLALGAGIAVDVFFAVVNFYPVAPTAKPGPELEVLAEMSEEHAAWFQANIVDEFNDENNTQLKLRLVSSDRVTEDLREHRNVLLAAIPGAISGELVSAQVIQPVEGIKPRATVNQDFSAIRREVLMRGEVDGVQYFLPRSSVMDLAAYRPSKVRDAVLHWPELKTFIDEALKQVNGYGLPDGYELERSPGEWDAFDQFVIAYYWAHRKYADLPARPRLAHRTDPGLAGDTYFLSSLYRSGATDETIRQPTAPAVLDQFQWEALYRQQGLYVNDMFEDGGMTAQEILTAFNQGRVFLASIDSLEAFRLHGGSQRTAEALLDNPEDLSFFALPRGASPELNEEHRPARMAQGFSFRDDSLWAVPKNNPDVELAYRFLQFAWSRSSHVRECEAIGILPVRRDIVLERSSIFRLIWQQSIFEGALSQWERAQPVPSELFEAGIPSRYSSHFLDLISNRGAMMNLATPSVEGSSTLPILLPRADLMARLQGNPSTTPTALPPKTPHDPNAPRDDGEPWLSPVVLSLPDGTERVLEVSR